MIIDLRQADTPELEEVGGKAYNLHRLIQLGMPVPHAFAVPASVHLRADDASILELLKNHIENHELLVDDVRYAVRSSGVGEDGAGNSYAGIFESYLDVPKQEVFSAIQEVWQSIESSRSKMYADERSLAVEKMGVVVQRMVDADFAGVAFSVCPVEKDARIALIEVVAGLGESLVSGQRTPATIRVNKITGVCRIHRHGADNLEANTLERIAEIITPLVEEIEEAYGMPVDVEWAILDDQPYILQARPITA